MEKRKEHPSSDSEAEPAPVVRRRSCIINRSLSHFAMQMENTKQPPVTNMATLPVCRMYSARYRSDLADGKGTNR